MRSQQNTLPPGVRAQNGLRLSAGSNGTTEILTFSLASEMTIVTSSLIPRRQGPPRVPSWVKGLVTNARAPAEEACASPQGGHTLSKSLIAQARLRGPPWSLRQPLAAAVLVAGFLQSFNRQNHSRCPGYASTGRGTDLARKPSFPSFLLPRASFLNRGDEGSRVFAVLLRAGDGSRSGLVCALEQNRGVPSAAPPPGSLSHFADGTCALHARPRSCVSARGAEGGELTSHVPATPRAACLAERRLLCSARCASAIPPPRGY